MPTAAALRGRLRPLAALAGAALVTACTASTGSYLMTGSHSATAQDVAQGYACALASFREPARPRGTFALSVISIADERWPTASVHQGRWRYWQKDALWIRAGHQPVTITVPNAWRTQAAITWGVNVGIVSALRLPGCPSAPGTWNGYAGGSTCGPDPHASRWWSVWGAAARWSA